MCACTMARTTRAIRSASPATDLQETSMALFQRLFFAVLLAGLISGAAMVALQQWRVVPLIIAAEAYEGVEAPAAHTHEAGTPAHSHDAAAPAHDHGGDEWMPADGFERTFY